MKMTSIASHPGSSQTGVDTEQRVADEALDQPF